MEGGGGGSERRKPKLTSQISVLDPAKIRDLIKTREDHHNFRRDSSLAGLTVDAVLGCDQGRQTQMIDNQPGRTLLDIICSDEDNSGAAYRGLVAQSNKKNGKQKNSKKSIKDRLRLRRSSRPVPTCDIPISNGRNINISNPFPPPQPPKRSTRISSSAAIPAVIDTKQVDDPIVPCYINEEGDDDNDEEEEQQQQQQQQKPMSKNQKEDDDEEEEEEQQHQPMSKNQKEDDDDDEEEEEQQHQPMSKNQEEEDEDDDDDKPKLKNDQDDDDDKEPMSKNDLEEEEHQPISKKQEEEEEEEEDEDDDDDDDNLEEEHQQISSNLGSRVGNAASGLLISELRAVDDEINGSNKLLISKTKEDDDDDDDDYDDDDDDEEEEEEEEPVKQVSLMALLEGTMGAEDDEEEEEEALDIEEDEVEVGGQYVCCVCMVRHNKGTSFSHCGHSFCRLCCKELYVSKGNCPLCNRYIMEIVEIF